MKEQPRELRLRHRSTSGVAAKRIALVTAVAAIAVPSAAAAGPTQARSVAVRAQLTIVTGTSSCHAGICTLDNHGRGQVARFGHVTFKTRITADGNAPPCGGGSWVRAIRTIKTNKGDLVLHEAGLECPQRGEPRVDLVWALDGVHSTGIFAGARGRGSDVAYPVRNTDAPRGTVILAS